MSPKQDASELIFASILGCLDWADQTRLNEYIKAGGELPYTVGEFQNIAALLPMILNPETPGPQLKDTVARKLYRVKDEVRAKVAGSVLTNAEIFYKNSRRDKQSNAPDENVTAPEPEKPGLVEDKIKTEGTENINVHASPAEDKVNEEKREEIKPEDFEPVAPLRSTFESFKSTREKVLEGNFEEAPREKKSVPEEEIKPEPKVPTREKIKTNERVITKEKIPHKTATKESPYYRNASTKDRSKSFERAYKKKYSTGEFKSGNLFLNSWVVISLFVVLLLGIAVIYLNFASEIKDLKFTNDLLQQKVNDLSVKFSTSQEIQGLIESADVKILNLEGTGINPVGKGKLLLSLSQNKGYIQLSDMPALGEDKSYQLWMVLSSGGYYSLGVFNPAGRVQYFPFNVPQSEISRVDNFIVTEEASSGALKPGNKIFLRGSFQ